MNIVFIGTVQFSKETLRKLIEIENSPVGVITKESSSFNADFASLVPLCEKHDIPYLFVKDIHKLENIEWIKNKKPDIIFCFGWSSLIQKSILDLPPMGVIGFHPAALPQNRGRHPIIWTLVLGLTHTASTFFFMDEGTDSGDILSQKPINIDYQDDAGSLYAKITQTALSQIQDFVPKLEKGNYVRKPQDESKATTWRKRDKNDGRIDFRMSSLNIYNLVRALARPYLGAHVEYKGQEIRIFKAREYEYSKPNIEPGKILFSGQNELVIKCGDNAISLIEHEFEKLPIEGEYLI